MRRLFVPFSFLLFVSGCAHLPSNLGGWATEKGLRLASCVAKHPQDRGELKACLGPDYIRDLGTEACGMAHDVLADLPAE